MTRITPQPAGRKTILYLDHTARMGGGEIALLNLLLTLDQRCYHPIVALASEGPLADKLRAAGIETHVEPLDENLLETRKDNLGLKSLLGLRQIGRLGAYTLRLARLARRWNVDLIHTNSLKSDFYGGMAGRLAGIPVLWHVRDNINGQYLPSPVATAFQALSRFLPRLVVANSESTLRTLYPALSIATAAAYSDPAQPLANSRLQVVHDGCPADDYNDIAAAQALPLAQPVVALVGRIAEWKGQHVFIRAAAETLVRFPQARFWIIGAPLFGEHEYEQSLHRLVQDLGVAKQVEFLGFRDDVPALLAQTALIVHASTLGEPFGQVVIEGMAAGKPVIATDGGALPEIIATGETGLLVPMGDASAMAAAIQALLGDPERAAAMGLAGRRRVRDRFTIEHTARKMERVYDQFLSPRQALTLVPETS